MHIGVIGADWLGGTVGRAWVQAGHEVLFYSRHPEGLVSMTRQLGSRASVGTSREAAEFGQVLLFAVPYDALPRLGRELQELLRGKVILDACNPASSQSNPLTREAEANGVGPTSAKYLPGTRLVRAFSAVDATAVEASAGRKNDKLAVPLAVGARPVAVRAVTGNWDPNRATLGAYHASLSFEDGTAASLIYSGYDRFDSNELQGWISELGFPLAGHEYGAARRRVRGLAGQQEDTKQSRTFGESDATTALPPHHEHFGWVLASCERADLRLTPDGVRVYEDEGHEFIPAPQPRGGRQAVIDAFVRAIRFEEPPVFDGEWGTITVACCEAILRSASKRREVAVESEPVC